MQFLSHLSPLHSIHNIVCKSQKDILIGWPVWKFDLILAIPNVLTSITACHSTVI